MLKAEYSPQGLVFTAVLLATLVYPSDILLSSPLFVEYFFLFQNRRRRLFSSPGRKFLPVDDLFLMTFNIKVYNGSSYVKSWWCATRTLWPFGGPSFIFLLLTSHQTLVRDDDESCPAPKKKRTPFVCPYGRKVEPQPERRQSANEKDIKSKVPTSVLVPWKIQRSFLTVIVGMGRRDAKLSTQGNGQKEKERRKKKEKIWMDRQEQQQTHRVGLSSARKREVDGAAVKVDFVCAVDRNTRLRLKGSQSMSDCLVQSRRHRHKRDVAPI